MGLDRFQKTPCGFCFVEYYTHQDALDCMKYIGGTKLDERIIRTDLDPGFQEGRQYGYAMACITTTFQGTELTRPSLDAVNLGGKSVTSLEMNSIPAEADMDAVWQMIIEWRYIQVGRLGESIPVRDLLSDTQEHNNKKRSK